jgi:hypothetical protein
LFSIQPKSSFDPPIVRSICTPGQVSAISPSQYRRGSTEVVVEVVVEKLDELPELLSASVSASSSESVRYINMRLLSAFVAIMTKLLTAELFEALRRAELFGASDILSLHVNRTSLSGVFANHASSKAAPAVTFLWFLALLVSLPMTSSKPSGELSSVSSTRAAEVGSKDSSTSNATMQRQLWDPATHFLRHDEPSV